MDDRFFMRSLAVSVLFHLVVFTAWTLLETGWHHAPAIVSVALVEMVPGDDSPSTKSGSSKQVDQPRQKREQRQHEMVQEADAVTDKVLAVSAEKSVSPGGANSGLVEAIPIDSENSPPPYPRFARQRGWTGEVWLLVRVAKTGDVLNIVIGRSSGYNILDQSALDAVKNWHFRAARFGSVAVETEVRVPVRFELRNT